MDNVIKNFVYVVSAMSMLLSGIVYADNHRTISQTNSTVKLSPSMRAQPLSSSKYTFQTATFLPYLVNMVIFDSEAAFEAQPYILSFVETRQYGVAGDIAYVTGITSEDNISSYSLLKKGTSLKNPLTKEYLGMQANVIGTSDVLSFDNPQTIRITKSNEEVELAVRLIQRTGLDLPAEIEASVPIKDMKGFVVFVATPTIGVGQRSTVVVSLGSREGLKVGDLLDLMEPPKDLHNTENVKKGTVAPLKFGEILIYKVMYKVSMGIILTSEHAATIDDVVESAAKGK